MDSFRDFFFKKKQVIHTLFLFKHYRHPTIYVHHGPKYQFLLMHHENSQWSTLLKYNIKYMCLSKWKKERKKKKTKKIQRKGNSDMIHNFRLTKLKKKKKFLTECVSTESWTKSHGSGCGFFRQMVSTDQSISQLGNGRRIDSFTKCHQTQYMKKRKRLESVLWYLILVTARFVK